MGQIIKTPTPILPKRNFSINEILLFTVLLSIILYVGKTLFVPLSFALLVSFILYPICKWLEKKGIGKVLSVFIGISLITMLIGTIIYLLFLQLSGFLDEWDILKIKFSESLVELFDFFEKNIGYKIDDLRKLPENFISSSQSQFFSIFMNTSYSISISAFYMIITPVFTALILYYRQLLVQAMYSLFPSEKKEEVSEILTEIINIYHNFIKGMLLIYLIVGLLNGIGLAIIGISHPFLFGFIASILTFIPYVGILISSLIPISISWITFNSIWYPIAVILVFTVVQLLEAYIIFPFIVGNRLKINAFAIIFVVILGGILWGAAGMILFIPFVSILKLIADRTEKLKTLSIILGTNPTVKKTTN